MIEAPPALLTALEFAALLKVGERTFHALRAQGVIPAPLALGPRLHRWTFSDFEEVVRGLPRESASSAEPEQLQASRRKASPGPPRADDQVTRLPA
jgi:predicted DNA-binding transcriptional regulator AlpA